MFSRIRSAFSSRGLRKKQGAIVRGIGGDNSDFGIGTFYEGVMTAGYTTDATDDATAVVDDGAVEGALHLTSRARKSDAVFPGWP